MIPLIVNGPAVEPLAVADAKKWLKLETSDEDDVIGALITAARLMVEAQIRRMLITQTWRLIYDCWPDGRIVKIPPAPFQSLTAMRVYDASGTPQAVSASLYYVDAAADAARIIFGAPPPAPNSRPTRQLPWLRIAMSHGRSIGAPRIRAPRRSKPTARTPNGSGSAAALDRARLPDLGDKNLCKALFSPYSSSTAKIAGAMRIFLIAIALALYAAAAALLAPLQSSAAQLAPLQCLTTDETREEIASARLIQPFVLMRRAAGETHAEAIDGRLCRWNNELIYEISLLRRDGHIVRVHFNAADGKAVERR